MNKRYHLIISGRVQGVFFRAFVKKAATLLGLTGFVRNKPDGTVEAVVEGTSEKLHELLEHCKKGPIAARVDAVEKKEEKATGEFIGFVVKY